MRRDVLIPATFSELIGPNKPAFDAMEVDNGFVMETLFCGWSYKHHDDALYDLLAEQFLDEQVVMGNAPYSAFRDRFDQYARAVKNTMMRVEPYLHGLDYADGNAADYIEVVSMHANTDRPYFIARIHFEE